MPLYDFACANGHVWSELRGFYDKDEPTTCRDCGEPGARIPSIPARPVVKGGTPKHHKGVA